MKSLIISTTALCYLSAVVLSNIKNLARLSFYYATVEVFFLWIHIAAGFMWSGLIIIFFIEHIKDKKKFLKTINKQSITGLLQILVVALISISGLFLLLYSVDHSEELLTAHYFASILIVISSIYHIGFKKILRSLKNKKTSPKE